MWNEIEIYFKGKKIGVIHTKLLIKKDIKNLIDSKFGEGMWDLVKFV